MSLYGFSLDPSQGAASVRRSLQNLSFGGFASVGAAAGELAAIRLRATVQAAQKDRYYACVQVIQLTASPAQSTLIGISGDLSNNSGTRNTYSKSSPQSAEVPRSVIQSQTSAANPIVKDLGRMVVAANTPTEIIIGDPILLDSAAAAGLTIVAATAASTIHVNFQWYEIGGGNATLDGGFEQSPWGKIYSSNGFTPR